MVAKPDEGDLLMIRRALSVEKSNMDEQTENIFHNMCTIQGKVWSLTTNNGSCLNVASISLFGKLRLQPSVLSHHHNI